MKPILAVTVFLSFSFSALAESKPMDYPGCNSDHQKIAAQALEKARAELPDLIQEISDFSQSNSNTLSERDLNQLGMAEKILSSGLSQHTSRQCHCSVCSTSLQ